MERKMEWRLKTAFFCYILCVLLGITFSITYLFRSEFMPYHAAAVEQSWGEVNPAFQLLIISLMKASGGGWLGVSMAVSLLLFGPFKQGMRWSYWAIPAIAFPPMFVTLYVTVKVALNTPATPPWPLAAIGLTLLMIGFVLSMTTKRDTVLGDTEQTYADD